MAFYLLNCFSRIPLNVHSPEEVCVPVCQMLSCLDKRPLKQTEMSHLITGFRVAWFCKRSFHMFNPLEVEHIYRNPLVCSSLPPFPTVHELPRLLCDTFGLFSLFCVMNQCRYRCFSTCLSVRWINSVLFSVYAFKLCATCND